jgi:hypothetical protein
MKIFMDKEDIAKIIEEYLENTYEIIPDEKEISEQLPENIAIKIDFDV